MLKPILLLGIALTLVPVHSGHGQGEKPAASTPAETAKPFTGKIVFHQKEGHVIYNVTVTDGRIGGYQSLDFNPRPIANFVGGWIDLPSGKLSLLIQGIAPNMDPRWRAQAQHFTIDPGNKTVTLEHMLYDFGSTLTTADDTPTEHVLDLLDGLVDLLHR